MRSRSACFFSSTLLRSVLGLLVASYVVSFLASCSGSKTPAINPRSVRISSSSATPAHRLSKYEYPFDDRGNYVKEWAAQGERRAGRPAVVSSSYHTHYSSRKSSSRSSSSARRVHTVGRGDTLWGLSRKYGKSVSAIKAANGLKSDTIKLGQKIRIP